MSTFHNPTALPPTWRTNPNGLPPNLNPVGPRPVFNPSPKGTFVEKSVIVKNRSGKLFTLSYRRPWGIQGVKVKRITRYTGCLLKSVQTDRIRVHVIPNQHRPHKI